MKQESFIDSVQELFPGCDRETAQGWIDFATENVEQEQYVNFIPEPNQAAAVEKWLDTLYAGLYQAKQDFGMEVASQICNLPLTQNYCLYPWEMKEASAYLQEGGDLDNVSQLSVDGEFDSGAPFFPTLKSTLHQENGERFRYYITNDALNIGTFPHMEGMTVKESVKPVFYENDTVKAFGFIEYPEPLTLEQTQEYCLTPSLQNTNYLESAEKSTEQNYNQLDGIINNEPPRANEERESLKDCRPSILSQLKSDAARKDLPTTPQPGHKKDAPER